MFVRDLQTGTTALVTINLTGTGSVNGFVSPGWLSGNGQFVTFGSNAHDIISTPRIFWRGVHTSDPINVLSVGRNATEAQILANLSISAIVNPAPERDRRFSIGRVAP